MLRTLVTVALAALLLACSSDNKTSQADCDALAQQIRDLAPKDGFSSNGICSNPSRTPDLRSLCDQLYDCNSRCCK